MRCCTCVVVDKICVDKSFFIVVCGFPRIYKFIDLILNSEFEIENSVQPFNSTQKAHKHVVQILHPLRQHVRCSKI